MTDNTSVVIYYSDNTIYMAKKTTQLISDSGRKSKNEVIKRVVKLHEENPNMSYQALGDAVGRDKSTVWRALKRYHIEKKTTQEFIANRSDILAGVNQKTVQKITDNLDNIDIKNTGDLKNLGVLFGIVSEKELLSRGQATQNVQIATVIELVDKRLKEKQSENA